MRLGRLGLVVLLVLVGCGGDDDADGGQSETTMPVTTPAKTAVPAGLGGEEKDVAEAVVDLLEARNSEDACFDSLGSEYVESLGGEDACAKRLDALVTGKVNRVATVRIVKPDTEATARVSGPAGRHVTIRLSKASSGNWNMTGASNLPR